MIDQDTPKRKVTIKWDEDAIREHDLERGTRQKIDEAPTPFRYDENDSNSECGSAKSIHSGHSSGGREVKHHWEVLNAQLTFHESQQKDFSLDKDEEIDEVAENKLNEFGEKGIEEKSIRFGEEQVHSNHSSLHNSPVKEENFKNKRLAHYNEFLVLKTLKQNIMNEDDEEDEDEEDEKVKNDKNDKNESK